MGKCGTIGCGNTATHELIYTFPESRTDIQRDETCEECGAGYCRRPTLRATMAPLDSADTAWRDAYHIAYVGASNPRAVERSLETHRAILPAEHPAIRAMAGHLAYLQGESLGPELEDLEAVKVNARRLGLIDEAGNYAAR